MSRNLYLRCDDRLVHGQILYRWLAALKFKNLVVIDNSAANDVIEKNIITMSVPKECQLFIFSERDVEKIKLMESDTLVLFSHLSVALTLLQKNITFKELNIGRISADIGKKQVSPGIYLSDNEVAIVKKLMENDIRIIGKMSPDDTSVELNQMILERGEE